MRVPRIVRVAPRRVAHAGGLAALAVVLTGCAAAAGTVAPPSPSLAGGVASDVVYETIAVSGDDGAGGWLPDHPVSLRIDALDGRPVLSVNGPCNGLGYDLESTGAAPLVWTIVDGPSTTFVGCLDVAGDREQWLLRVLDAEAVTLTQTATTLRIRSGPVTIDATAVPTEGPPGTPIATAAAEGPLVDVEQLTNPALDLANGAGVRLSTLSAEEKERYPIYAVTTTYEQLADYDPGLADHYWIAPDEPVRALSVHAPSETSDAPYGFPIKKWDVFTAVYDGISGELLTSAGGVDLRALGAPGELITAD